MEEQTIRRALVIGTGLMGPGIAYSLAAAGCQVSLYARTEQSVAKGLRSVTAGVETLVQGGCLAAASGAERLARIAGTTDLATAAGQADLVTESIVEDLAVKQELFSRLEGLCPAQTILTSNTSGLPATAIAEPLRRPERFAVTHFWNPPHLMPLVEVVKGARTAEETVQSLVALLRGAGKKPVVVRKDTPGQLGNRLFHALIREAFWVVQEGIASAEDVDTAVKNGLGRRFPVYGVLEHQDVVGLDMVLAIQTYMCQALCNETAPAQLLRDKVAAGELGVKSGAGVYDWRVKDVKEVTRKRDNFLVELLKSEQAEPGD
ncbi:MAG: 3-hydroxyacyl-CoA dehydrogenase family protein [Chloroflexi bacterium]|nr:3-hydroxyacyl-CoA dehydrogenase family protein [Chloroflexota bacterium]MCL5108901.1 3-hydroxyacyl-CoA dehydrogenase family protein [Chloroflexota bacterium]